MELNFRKILIANRGEIACRICRTASKMGIRTVAIYSTADKNSLHVRMADEAFWVGESPSQHSYLNIEAIIAIAKQAKADAIHPGYGFLSENPGFAIACQKAGIVFIGPSIEALEIMGSKKLSKQRLEHTAVPLTPGFHGNAQTDDILIQKAGEVGFPLLLKAAAGGGGKGMRAVYAEAELADAIQGAKRESRAWFADETLIIEKLIENARHIEVQIIADNFGQVLHLFERDCSIQRRNQKIVEEAPAPFLDKDLRDRLHKSAVEVASAIDYRGAGTVEFLLDETAAVFYFMEMNTRLQVEHPVTELITGIDLVEWQINIAQNLPLPLAQHDIQAKGHAIECRIYAEDPANDFIPSIGKILFLKEPQGNGIRLDSAVDLDSEISQFYDPMIAKLIVLGDNRPQALSRLQQALKQYFIGGIRTNIPFLQAICAQPAFVEGQYTTRFLTRETLEIPTASIEAALPFALAYQYLSLFEAEQDPLFKETMGFQVHLEKSWDGFYAVHQKPYPFTLFPKDEKSFQYTCETLPAKDKLQAFKEDDRIVIEKDGKMLSAFVKKIQQDLLVFLPQGVMIFDTIEPKAGEEQQTIPQLTAPMHATIVAILKNPGDQVKKGEPLMILEAMKMEHAIYAPADSLVVELFYPPGAQVEEGALLLRLEEDAGENVHALP